MTGRTMVLEIGVVAAFLSIGEAACWLSEWRYAQWERRELGVVRMKVLCGASCVDVHIGTREKPWGIKGTTYLP